MSNYCLKNTLKYILLLQNNSLNICSLYEGCTKPYLGPKILGNYYNSRVLNIYLCNGSLLSSNYYLNNNISSSIYYRVTKIEDDCVTLLILRYDSGYYYSTKEYITISLKCIGALRCIQDVYVSNL